MGMADGTTRKKRRDKDKSKTQTQAAVLVVDDGDEGRSLLGDARKEKPSEFLVENSAPARVGLSLTRSEVRILKKNLNAGFRADFKKGSGGNAVEATVAKLKKHLPSIQQYFSVSEIDALVSLPKAYFIFLAVINENISSFQQNYPTVLNVVVEFSFKQLKNKSITGTPHEIPSAVLFHHMNALITRYSTLGRFGRWRFRSQYDAAMTLTLERMTNLEAASREAGAVKLGAMLEKFPYERIKAFLEGNPEVLNIFRRNSKSKEMKKAVNTIRAIQEIDTAEFQKALNTTNVQLFLNLLNGLVGTKEEKLQKLHNLISQLVNKIGTSRFQGKYETMMEACLKAVMKLSDPKKGLELDRALERKCLAVVSRYFRKINVSKFLGLLGNDGFHMRSYVRRNVKDFTRFPKIQRYILRDVGHIEREGYEVRIKRGQADVEALLLNTIGGAAFSAENARILTDTYGADVDREYGGESFFDVALKAKNEAAIRFYLENTKQNKTKILSNVINLCVIPEKVKGSGVAFARANIIEKKPGILLAIKLLVNNYGARATVAINKVVHALKLDDVSNGQIQDALRPVAVPGAAADLAFGVNDNNASADKHEEVEFGPFQGAPTATATVTHAAAPAVVSVSAGTRTSHALFDLQSQLARNDSSQINKLVIAAGDEIKFLSHVEKRRLCALRTTHLKQPSQELIAKHFPIYLIADAIRLKDLEYLKSVPVALFNEKDDLGITLLHQAVDSDFEAGVEWLLAQRVNVNAQTNKGITPIAAAIAKGKNQHVGIIARLRAAGAVEPKGKEEADAVPAAAASAIAAASAGSRATMQIPEDQLEGLLTDLHATPVVKISKAAQVIKLIQANDPRAKVMLRELSDAERMAVEVHFINFGPVDLFAAEKTAIEKAVDAGDVQAVIRLLNGGAVDVTDELISRAAQPGRNEAILNFLLMYMRQEEARVEAAKIHASRDLDEESSDEEEFSHLESFYQALVGREFKVARVHLLQLTAEEVGKLSTEDRFVNGAEFQIFKQSDYAKDTVLASAEVTVTHANAAQLIAMIDAVNNADAKSAGVVEVKAHYMLFVEAIQSKNFVAAKDALQKFTTKDQAKMVKSVEELKKSRRFQAFMQSPEGQAFLGEVLGRDGSSPFDQFMVGLYVPVVESVVAAANAAIDEGEDELEDDSKESSSDDVDDQDQQEVVADPVGEELSTTDLLYNTLLNEENREEDHVFESVQALLTEFSSDDFIQLQNDEELNGFELFTAFMKSRFAGDLLADVVRTKPLQYLVYLLEIGININQVGSRNMTAIHAAVAACKPIAVRFLLQHGANVRVVAEGVDVLTRAQDLQGKDEAKKQEIIGLIEAHIAAMPAVEVSNVESDEEIIGELPALPTLPVLERFYDALESDDFEEAKNVLKEFSAEDFAELSEHPEPEFVPQFRVFALSTFAGDLLVDVIHEGNTGLFRNLMKIMTPDTRDSHEMTALHWAVNACHPDAVNFLLTQGADIHIVVNRMDVLTRAQKLEGKDAAAKQEIIRLIGARIVAEDVSRRVSRVLEPEEVKPVLSKVEHLREALNLGHATIVSEAVYELQEEVKTLDEDLKEQLFSFVLENLNANADTIKLLIGLGFGKNLLAKAEATENTAAVEFLQSKIWSATRAEATRGEVVGAMVVARARSASQESPKTPVKSPIRPQVAKLLVAADEGDIGQVEKLLDGAELTLEEKDALVQRAKTVDGDFAKEVEREAVKYLSPAKGPQSK
jgi:ankyrin repeat protein